MTDTPQKPTPITCQCGQKPIDAETIAKLEAKVHRHSAAIEQALAEIRKLLTTDDRNERIAA